jgi:hypothetical protein
MARIKKEFILPSSPADLKKIQDAIEEYASSLTRQAAEKDLQKDIYTALKEGEKEGDGIDIPKGIFTAMAKTYYAASFNDVVDKAEQFQTAYETIMKDKDPSVMED